MTQLTTVVLKDAAAADHSFIPRDISGGVATLVNSTGVPIGERTVSVSNTKTSTNRRKATMKLVVPIVQDVVVAGVSKPTVVRTAYADLTFTFDGTSNHDERADALAYLVSALADTSVFKPAIVDLSAPY